MLLETFGYVLWRFLFMFLKVSPSGSFPPPLSREKEQALFCDMANGDQKARETLICHNLRLVAHIVKKYYPSATDQEELVSIGTIGLIKAIDTFDASKGARFATYAGRCVQNEILMHFRAQKKLGAEVSIDETIDTDKDGNPMTYMDIIHIEDTIVEDLDTRLRSQSALRAMCRVLDRRERQILILRYGLQGDAPLTQRAVAQKLHISRSSVCRIEKNALEKVRRALKQSGY